METKVCGIYKITSPSGRVYIGQAIDIHKRWSRYKNLHKCVIGQTKLHRSLIKYGVENHYFEIVEKCESNILLDREGHYQDQYDSVNNGLNCMRVKTSDKSGYLSQDTKNKIGLSNLGKIPSKEKRDNMSKIMSGENNPMYNKKGKDHPAFGRTGELNGMYGKTHSEDTKNKIRETLKNKYLNKIHPNTGRVHTEETKKSMSDSKKGKRLGGLNTSAKKVIDTETQIVYDTVKEAAEKFNLVYGVLLKRLKGKFKNNTTLKYLKND